MTNTKHKHTDGLSNVMTGHKSYDRKANETYVGIMCNGCGDTIEEYYEAGNTTNERIWY